MEEDIVKEMTEHEMLSFCVEYINDKGLYAFLLRLADRCEYSPDFYALGSLALQYKERESGFCKDAPPML